MNLKRFFTILTIGVVCFALASCKDEDDDTTYSSFTGTVTFDLPAFVAPGETFTVVPSGVSRSDDGDYGIAWSTTTVPAISDTVKLEGTPGDGAFTFTVPSDSCYTFTVTCKYFAEGYYTTSGSSTLIIADPNRFTGSLLGLELGDLDFLYVDPRDNHEYYCATVGDHDWFKENLKYFEIGRPYYNCEAMGEVTGCFYSWENAKKACPDGWRLPTQQDFFDLIKYYNDKGIDFTKDQDFTGMAGQMMADCYFNGEKMWEFWPQVKITNKTGFSAIPLGYSVVDETDSYSYFNALTHAAFWTADECDSERAFYRYMYDQAPDVYTGVAYKDDFAANVRCVR